MDVGSLLTSPVDGSTKDYKEAYFELKIIEGRMGHPLTDEQREFAVDFTRDIITFANPGTGKTHTLTAGILMAQNYWKIPPKKIFCMSYTNAAKDEIKGRYEDLTVKMRSFKGVEFGTFHSLSNKILRDAYGDMQLVNEYPADEVAEDMAQYLTMICPEYPFDRKKTRQIVKTIANLNSSFTFDPENVETKYAISQLKLNVSDFQQLRRLWFERGLINGCIERGEIPLYCLYALIKKPEVANVWKGRYEVMIVDEFQDLSILDLEILSRVAKKLIVVGDMKQQIYVFSGACPEIVDAYKKSRPNATVCRLTKSFRCPQAIADLASRVIAPNLEEDAGFSGRDETTVTKSEDCIHIMDRRNMNWGEIFKDITNEELNDYLILYRNNASTIPVIDQLYQKKIPYRCTKFVKVMDIPVLNTICKLIDAAINPNNPEVVQKALEQFPEFRYNKYTIPIPPMIRKLSKSLFEINYRYEEQSSRDILAAMERAREAVMQKKSAGSVIMCLMQVYEKYIYPKEWVDNEIRYYLNMVAPICNNMTYPEMVLREKDKQFKCEEAMDARIGVRCYTMHTSKGLEANHVYLLDVNEGLFPNAEQLEKKTKAHCLYDASLDVRSERNLLYVAITRAKKDLYISYSNGQVATLLSSPEDNMYRSYDEVYKSEHKLYDDLESFTNLLARGANNE